MLTSLGLGRFAGRFALRAVLALVWIQMLAPGLLNAQSPIPAGKPEVYPDWWFANDIIARKPESISDPSPEWPDDYDLADDYGVANVGQLKHIATKALEVLDAVMPPGVMADTAGATLAGIVSAWYPANEDKTEYYEAVNIGQVKALAKLFYDVLAAVGYVASTEYPPELWTETYPWSSLTTDDDNYAVANLGQVKFIFSFDPYFSADGDDLPDWWEMYYFHDLDEENLGDYEGDLLSNYAEFVGSTDPTDYYNGVVPVLTVLPPSQDAMVGTSTAAPFVAHVEVGGLPAANAPVSIAILSGDGTLDDLPDPLRTDSGGYLEFHVIAGNELEDVTHIEVVAGAAEPIEVTVTAISPALTWGMNEGTGAAIAAAESDDYDGTLAGGTAWGDGADGTSGLVFSGFTAESGGNDRVNFGSPANGLFDFGASDFTLLVWVKFATATPPSGSGRVIVAKGVTESGIGYHLSTHGTGSLDFGIGSSSGVAGDALAIGTVEEFDDGNWHHVAVVVDRTASTAVIYVDGVQQELAVRAGSGATITGTGSGVGSFSGLTTLSASASASSLFLGSRQGTEEFFLGSMDDFQIHRNALLLPEIEEIRNKDLDEDEMPDWWEVASGMDPDLDDRFEDEDGDQYPNYYEWLHGKRAGEAGFDDADPRHPVTAPPAYFTVDAELPTDATPNFSTLGAALAELRTLSPEAQEYAVVEIVPGDVPAQELAPYLESIELDIPEILIHAVLDEDLPAVILQGPPAASRTVTISENARISGVIIKAPAQSAAEPFLIDSAELTITDCLILGSKAAHVGTGRSGEDHSGGLNLW